mgnify:CR=1 FL=1
MLNDLRKRVGIKTDKELEAKRYEQNLHDRPKASAEEYFELGNMHQRAGDKKAAIAAFLNAANLAIDAEDLTIAMAANRIHPVTVIFRLRVLHPFMIMVMH